MNYKPLLIQKESQKLKKKIKRDLMKLPKLDEKRVAMRQFIEQGEKLIKKGRFDFIVYPLFSGLIPAVLFNELHCERNTYKLLMFEYHTISSLGKKELTKSSTQNRYNVTFGKEAEKIIDIIANNLMEFCVKNKIDTTNAKILLIDANIAKGYTIAYFIKVLEIFDYNFKNLTLVITDSRADHKEFKQIPKTLLRGGKFIAFNQSNMTNKVFDHVLKINCYKKTPDYKYFNGKNIVFDNSALSFYPYYLAMAIFKDEYSILKKEK